MSKARVCEFCGTYFFPRGPQRFCSLACRTASAFYTAERLARQETELESLKRLHERREKGLTVCACKCCCSWFYGPPGAEYCSENCERLWHLKNATGGKKSNADAVSMYKLRECTEAETTRKNGFKSRIKGIPEPYRKSLELAREWAE